MTDITRYEWIALAYPALGAAAAVAATVQASADGRCLFIWDDGTAQAMVFQSDTGTWLGPIALPAVPIAWSNLRGTRAAFLTKQPAGPAFGSQYLWTVDFAGVAGPYRSPDVAAVSSVDYPASAGPYHLWNNGRQAVFSFVDFPDHCWLAYQDFTGKSMMLGWIIGTATLPEFMIAGTDTQLSIQLVQQGSQKRSATLFGDPAPMEGFPRGWLFNKVLASIRPPTVGAAHLGGWPQIGWSINHSSSITFGGPATWLVQFMSYSGAIFGQDAVPSVGLAGYAIDLSCGAYPGGHAIVLGPRSWAQFNAGGPLASVGYFPFNAYTNRLGLPLLAGPPTATGANYHGFLMRDIPFILDDANNFVFLGLVTFSFNLTNCGNWTMFGTLGARG